MKPKFIFILKFRIWCRVKTSCRRCRFVKLRSSSNSVYGNERWHFGQFQYWRSRFIQSYFVQVSLNVNSRIFCEISLFVVIWCLTSNYIFSFHRGNFKGMIHLWYMPGDSYLLSPLHQGQGGRKAYIHQGNTGKQHKSYLDGVPVASLAIPLGVRSGTIIFPCGAILQAGPHRALLTINGKMILTNKKNCS